jgi:hypothetical protein
MRSPFHFIVEPVGGSRYDNVKSIGGIDFITSSSKEDHKASNRYAKVLATPIGYTGEVMPGDTVIVHHNVFKFYNDIHGNERSGRSHLFDGIFLIDDDQFYLYKRDNEWKAYSRYCFVMPEKRMDNYILSKIGNEEYLRGTLIYPNQDLIDKGLNSGDKVAFIPESEYEFEIDGVTLYRMYSKNVCIELNGVK